MRKLFIILCMFSCYSLCIAQDIKYDSIQNTYTIRVREDKMNDTIALNLLKHLKKPYAENIVKNPQKDFLGKEGKAVIIDRDTTNKIIKFIFNVDQYNEDISRRLITEGITLTSTCQADPSIRVLIQCIDPTLLEILNNQTAILQGIDSLQKLIPNTSSTLTNDYISKLSNIEFFLPIIANAIIAIILSIIIVTLVYIRIGKKKEEITIKKEPHIEKGFESIKEMFNILRDEQNKGLNQIAQFRKKLEYIQQLQIDYINKKGEEEKSHKPASPLSDSTTDTNNSPTNPIPKTGYITTLNRTIYDKDILPTSNEFCIFEIMFLNEKEAKYFINTDPKALPNIVSSAFMLGDSCIDETRGKQATSVQTNEPGILRRDGGHWTIIKPTKFTIK